MPDTPTTVTPNEASDSPLANVMLNPGGASDAPIPPDAMLPPTHQVDTYQGRDYPAPAAMQEPQPTAESHLSAIGDILGKVAGLITGDEKWTVTRDKDGNTTAERTPMTTSEKWGRIAAAALGGAARGFAAGQGPGGAAKAVGAGFQQGFQMPQQQQQQAFTEADQANREMLFKANRASLNQDIVRKTLANKEADTKAGVDEVNMTNGMLKRLSDAPGSVDAGVFQTPAEVYRIPQDHPELFKGHPNGVVEAYPVYNPNHSIKGFQAYIVDKAWADQKTTEDRDYYEWQPNPQDPVNGDPVLVKRNVKAGQTTEGAYANGMMKTVTQGLDFQKKKADIDKANRTPTPKTWQEAQIAADAEKDPAKKAELQKTADDVFAKTKQLKAKAAKEGGGGSIPSGPQVTSPAERDAYLATLTPADRGTIRAIGEVREPPPNRFTKEGERVLGILNQAYPGYDATQYPVYQKTKIDFSPAGQSGKGLNFVGTALNHLDRMEKHIPKNVSIPFGIGTVINTAKNAAFQSTDPKLGKFFVAQKAVTNEISRAYTGGVLTEPEKKHMLELINSSDSPEVLRGNIQEFRDLLQGKLDSYQTGWESAMPRSIRNPVLDRLMQRTTQYRDPGDDSQATPAAPAAPAANGQQTGSAPAANTPPKIPKGEPNFRAAPKQPASAAQHPGMIYGSGSQGEGWYPL
jgi:hypothetical protein